MSQKFPNKIANSPSVALQTEHALKIMDKTDQDGGAAKGEEPRIPEGEPGGGRWTIESHPETNTLRITDPNGRYEDRIGGSPAWRHNNPGNLAIKKRGNPHLYGAIGASGSGDDQYLIFKTQKDGEAALKQHLAAKAATGMTLLEMMKEYAPKQDHNDPVAYTNAIAKYAGIASDTKLNAPEGQAALAKINEAIHRHEGWREGTIRRSSEGNP